MHIKLILLSFSVLFFSCKKKGCTDPSAINYDSSAQIDNGSCVPKTAGSWMFELDINGIVHKAEGIMDYPYDYIYPGSAPVSNGCQSHSLNSEWIVTLGISDKSAVSYISGDNGYLTVTIENPTVGICNAKIGGSYIDFGQPLLTLNEFTFNPDTLLTTVPGNYIPINITNLGSSMDLSPSPIYGSPLIGSISTTIYLCSGFLSGYGYVFDIPVNIELEFQAQRLS